MQGQDLCSWKYNNKTWCNPPGSWYTTLNVLYRDKVCVLGYWSLSSCLRDLHDSVMLKQAGIAEVVYFSDKGALAEKSAGVAGAAYIASRKLLSMAGIKVIICGNHLWHAHYLSLSIMLVTWLALEAEWAVEIQLVNNRHIVLHVSTHLLVN